MGRLKRASTMKIAPDHLTVSQMLEAIDALIDASYVTPDSLVYLDGRPLTMLGPCQESDDLSLESPAEVNLPKPKLQIVR